MALKTGEGGALEKGETKGDVCGEVSSALEKMNAVSVRLRWYRLNGFPAEKQNRYHFQNITKLHKTDYCFYVRNFGLSQGKKNHTTTGGSRTGGAL